MLLRAGNLTLLYHGGSLRYFTIEGQEVLRRIYVAIRDGNWGTADIQIQEERIEPSEDTFEIHYRWSTETPRMEGHVHIQGNMDGSVTFDWEGTALKNFSKNRVGLCILHPVEGFRGKSVRIIHPNGEDTPAKFPDLIMPHQPFLTIAAMEWDVTPKLKAQIELEGDIFETEDQRNYSDTSYKTYATPQSLPKPVEVEAGETFHQRATLTFTGEWPPFITPDTSVRIDMAGDPQSIPAWGLTWPELDRPISTKEIELLRKLTPAHILLRLDLRKPDWEQDFQATFEQIEKVGIPVQLAVLIDEQYVPSLRLFKSKPLIKEVILLNENGLTTSELLDRALPLLESRWPALKIGGGTNGFFVNFNRHPFEYSRVDFVSYSVSPQVHTFDEVSIIENLAGQADTVRTAAERSGKPVYVSPVLLAPDPDERLHTNFAASWTVGSFKHLAEAGAASVTYYEAFGPNGILVDDQPTPLYQWFAFLSEFKPERVIPSRVSQPLRCSSLILEKGNKWKTTLLANHTTEELQIRLPGAATITLGPYEWRAVF